MKLITRWIVVALALAAAAWLVPGIHVEGSSGWITVAVMALALGFVNAIIRPLLTF
ncbi:MAG: phage holin family protein, partial [Anaerolineae bacterium]|nr:phage holin family protein [Anaerolineae bacterium]